MDDKIKRYLNLKKRTFLHDLDFIKGDEFSDEKNKFVEDYFTNIFKKGVEYTVEEFNKKIEGTVIIPKTGWIFCITSYILIVICLILSLSGII